MYMWSIPLVLMLVSTNGLGDDNSFFAASGEDGGVIPEVSLSSSWYDEMRGDSFKEGMRANVFISPLLFKNISIGNFFASLDTS